MNRIIEAAEAAIEALAVGRDYVEGERFENAQRYKGHEHMAPDDDAALAQINDAANALAAAVQAMRDGGAEPVAWIYWHPSDDTHDGPDTIHKEGFGCFSSDDRAAMERVGWRFTPLYATPPTQDAQWQPIETAPPPGTRTMFVVIAFGARAGTYNSDAWAVWRYDDGVFARWPHAFPPTHWMPLPAPPATPKEGSPT